jgi:hypothetical protein
MRPGLTSEERAELARLRRENRSLREDVEVLKRATAFCEGDPVKAQPFIGAERAAGHGVARACRLLKVSRAACRGAGLEGRRQKRWRTTIVADPAAERARDPYPARLRAAAGHGRAPCR